MENTKSNRTSDERRKRINRIKKTIIIIVAILIIVPIVFCVILFAKVCSLEKQLDDLVALNESGKLVKTTDVKGRVHININYESDKNENNLIAAVDVPIKNNFIRETSVSEAIKNSSENETTKENVENDKSDASVSSIEKKNKRGLGKVVCLTFDDGPSETTEEILDILDEYGVKATFFVCAKENEELQKKYKYIVDRGHSLGIHSYSHVYSEVYKNIDSFKKDVLQTHDLIYELTGVDTKLYRFPGGSANSTVKMDIHECIDYLNEEGYTYYDWNVSSGDAVKDLLTVDQIMDNIENDVFKYNTSIILMHDAAYKPTTVEALPGLIEMLKDEGFDIRAIDNNIKTVQQIRNK